MIRKFYTIDNVAEPKLLHGPDGPQKPETPGIKTMGVSWEPAKKMITLELYGEEADVAAAVATLGTFFGGTPVERK